MKPRPLYRSITFWSGILVMAFIGWAWRDSRLMMSTAMTPGGMVTSGFSGLTFEWNRGFTWEFQRERQSSRDSQLDRPLPAPFFFRGEGVPRPRTTEARIAMVREMMIAVDYRTTTRIRMKFSPQSDVILFIPHWLLLLAVALPWSGLLLWRARRHHRARQSIRK